MTGLTPALLDHLLGISDRTAHQQPTSLALGRHCCIAAAAWPSTLRYALSLLIHHSTLGILLWDGAAYNTAVDRIDLCAPGAQLLFPWPSDPSAVFSSAGLRRDHFLFATTLRASAHSRRPGPPATYLLRALAPGLVRAPTFARPLAWCSGSLPCAPLPLPQTARLPRDSARADCD